MAGDTYVLEQSTGLPVYLRVAAGNVTDATLECTSAELRLAGLPASWAVLDAHPRRRAFIDELRRAGFAV